MSYRYLFIGVILSALSISSCSSQKGKAQKTLMEMSKHRVRLPPQRDGLFS